MSTETIKTTVFFFRDEESAKAAQDTVPNAVLTHQPAVSFSERWQLAVSDMTNSERLAFESEHDVSEVLLASDKNDLPPVRG